MREDAQRAPWAQASRRGFLCGCAACAAAALLRPAVAQEAPPPLGFRALADHIWLHTSWLKVGQAYAPSNGLVVMGDGEVLLIDTAWTEPQTDALLRRIGEVAPGAPITLLVTHAHEDRMAGLHLLHRRGARSLAHAETRALATARGFGTVQQSWSGSEAMIGPGGRRVELLYPGPAHTRDNVVAYVPDAELLFGGCMIRSKALDTLGNMADAVLCRWPAALDAVARRFGRANTVVPGHGDAGAGDLIDHTRALAQAASAKLACG